MRKTCKVTLNSESFSANCGDLLLDAALMNSIGLPQHRPGLQRHRFSADVVSRGRSHTRNGRSAN